MSSVQGQFGYGRPTGIGQIIKTNLLLYLDGANYPGSGTTWPDQSPSANNATGLTGVTYSSANGGYLSFNGGGSGLLDGTKYNTSYAGKTIFVAGNLTGITTGTFRAMVGSASGPRNFNLYMYSPSANTYQLHFSSGGVGSFSGILSYTPGNWFTAAITHQTDGTLTYYFNGVQSSQTPQTFNQYQAGSTEYVGRADNFWYGPLAIVSIYTSALSAADILVNHNAVKDRFGL